MKNTILFALVMTTLMSNAQISLDLLTTKRFSAINLNQNKTRYIDWNDYEIDTLNQFTLYNLDGTLFKTIHMPPKPDTLARVDDIFWITEELFDNDPNTIEYAIHYTWPDPWWNQYDYARIIREDGTILLDEADGYMYAHAWTTGASCLFQTEEGLKLKIDYYSPESDWYQEKIFSIPGTIPNSVNDTYGEDPKGFAVYPNPNNGQFVIEMNTSNHDRSTINLYSSGGRLTNV